MTGARSLTESEQQAVRSVVDDIVEKTDLSDPATCSRFFTVHNTGAWRAKACQICKLPLIVQHGAEDKCLVGPNQTKKWASYYNAYLESIPEVAQEIKWALDATIAANTTSATPGATPATGANTVVLGSGFREKEPNFPVWTKNQTWEQYKLEFSDFQAASTKPPLVKFMALIQSLKTADRHNIADQLQRAFTQQQKQTPGILELCKTWITEHYGMSKYEEMRSVAAQMLQMAAEKPTDIRGFMNTYDAWITALGNLGMKLPDGLEAVFLETFCRLNKEERNSLAAMVGPTMISDTATNKAVKMRECLRLIAPVSGEITTEAFLSEYNQDQGDEDEEDDEDQEVLFTKYRKDFANNRKFSKFSNNKFKNPSYNNSFRNQGGKFGGAQHFQPHKQIDKVDKCVQDVSRLSKAERDELVSKLSNVFQQAGNSSDAYLAHADTSTNVIIDSGSKFNIIGSSLVSTLRDNVETAGSTLVTRPCNRPFRFGGGEPIISTTLAIVPIRIAGKFKSVEVYIVDSDIPFLIGGDLLRDLEITANFSSSQMWCEDNPEYRFSFFTLKSGHISLPWTSDLHRTTNKVMKLFEPVYCVGSVQPIFLLTEDDMYNFASHSEGLLLSPPPLL